MSSSIRRLVSCTLVFILVALPASAATFTVDDTGDGADANPGNGICATSGGVCTLRAAVQEANSLSGSDTIEFDIAGGGPHVIQPSSALPAISPGVITLDGASEPDYSSSPVIEIDGTNAGADVDGLVLRRSSVVRALAIVNFDGDGLVLDGTFSSTIQNNYIGLKADGSAGGNGSAGIYITNNSDSNLIQDNVISENDGRGIFIGVGDSDDNTIAGNLIGTDPSGSTAMGNFFEGVLVNGVSGTTIGGTSPSTRNVISGNGSGGVLITGGATSTTVSGNYIGVAGDGQTALGNGSNGPSSGVEASSGATGTTIGGTASGATNVVSGHADDGVLITGSGTAATVQGNRIGTNAAGDARVSNDASGIEVASGASATIGGTTSGAGNVIAGNDEYEIRLGTNGNTVQGNYLDTNANGDDLGSSFNALRVAGDNNQIGGTSASAANVVGHTNTHAVYLTGSVNTLQGNYVGEMPDGTPVGTAGVSVRVAGSGNTIGGIGAGEGNTLAHAGWGVSIESGTGHTVRGNRIYDHSQDPHGITFDRFSGSPTSNDAGDSDTGPNRQQNFPEIQSADYDSGADEVTVTYQVPSDPSLTGSGASAYDLAIDFYRADANGSGSAYLSTDTYTTTDYNNGPSKQITFTPAAAVTRSDKVVATATDANGNTSEFTATVRQLPVELTTFDARVHGESVDLTWATASETNNAGFAVQRKSAPDTAFERVGFVEGHGTTARTQHYQFEDAARPYEARRITYRLKQVDIDGTAHYSGEVEVDIGSPDVVALRGNYPNPVRQTTTIRYELPQATHVRLTLHDLLGRRVALLVNRKQGAGRKSMQVETGGLASGMYVYRLEVDSTVKVRRMTVTH
jgi:CSLREA domain-containing protein